VLVCTEGDFQVFHKLARVLLDNHEVDGLVGLDVLAVQARVAGVLGGLAQGGAGSGLGGVESAVSFESKETFGNVILGSQQNRLVRPFLTQAEGAPNNLLLGPLHFVSSFDHFLSQTNFSFRLARQQIFPLCQRVLLIEKGDFQRSQAEAGVGRAGRQVGKLFLTTRAISFNLRFLALLDFGEGAVAGISSDEGAGLEGGREEAGLAGLGCL
jgi:hypothetical protein